MRGRDIKNGRFADNGSVPVDPLREKLDRLSLRLVEQMLGETDRNDPDRRPLSGDDVALYKAVSSYYTATRKMPTAKPDDDADDGFAALKERLNAGSDAPAADC
jgi:hypothetical protein